MKKKIVMFFLLLSVFAAGSAFGATQTFKLPKGVTALSLLFSEGTKVNKADAKAVQINGRTYVSVDELKKKNILSNYEVKSGNFVKVYPLISVKELQYISKERLLQIVLKSAASTHTTAAWMHMGSGKEWDDAKANFINVAKIDLSELINQKEYINSYPFFTDYERQIVNQYIYYLEDASKEMESGNLVSMEQLKLLGMMQLEIKRSIGSSYKNFNN